MHQGVGYVSLGMSTDMSIFLDLVGIMSVCVCTYMCVCVCVQVHKPWRFQPALRNQEPFNPGHAWSVSPKPWYLFSITSQGNPNKFPSEKFMAKMLGCCGALSICYSQTRFIEKEQQQPQGNHSCVLPFNFRHSCNYRHTPYMNTSSPLQLPQGKSWKKPLYLPLPFQVGLSLWAMPGSGQLKIVLIKESRAEILRKWSFVELIL